MRPALFGRALTSLLFIVAAGCAGRTATPGGVAAPTIAMSSGSTDTIPPRVRRIGRFEMPQQAVQCGFNGDITLEFTVDTTGRVPARTLRTLQVSRRMFETPSRRMVLDSEFVPAQAAGRRVAAVVRTTLHFHVSGGSEMGYSGPWPPYGCATDR